MESINTSSTSINRLTDAFNRTALVHICIDLQQIFFPEDDEIIPFHNAKRLSELCRPSIQNIWIAMASSIPLTGLDRFHCVQPDETHEPTFTKTDYSAFTNPDLEKYLRAQKIDTLIISGISAHLCVKHTIKDAVAKGFNIIVAIDATDLVNQSCDAVRTLYGENVNAVTLPAFENFINSVQYTPQTHYNNKPTPPQSTVSPIAV